MQLSDYIEMFPGHSRDKDKFMQMATVILTQVVELQAVIDDIATSFTLNASGSQLDIFAASFGLSRLDTTDGVDVSDADFRDYISKKLILWGWDGTNKSAIKIAQLIAPGCTFNDNQNGKVTITNEGTLPASEKQIMPVPAGIAIL